MTATPATETVTIQAQGKTITCPKGANLRQVLLDNGIDLYNGPASAINCHGLGTCGTCAVRVNGELSPMGPREKIRLSIPPHSPDSGLRLACRVRVLGNVSVTKETGFWGHAGGSQW